MPSILPDYEYDIFISYRQNDNLDEWVSQFVTALQNELKATLKDEVSIYFDENPHDGINETHDVDQSLKEKIKCLVFIPIISQTFCDPTSFAWRSELLPFINFALEDSLGLDIKLKNGNVAKRILPIKIHEIDPEDDALYQQVTNGVMRSVDFIYTSSGVNRPLRIKEERPDENLNRTIYRDQINKTANSIKELISALKRGSIASSTEIATDVVLEAPSVDQKVNTNSKRTKPKPFPKAILLVLGFIVLMIAGYFIVNQVVKQKKISNAQDQAATTISNYLDFGEESEWTVFELYEEIKEVIPDNPIINKYASSKLVDVEISSDPPGAKVYARSYSDTTIAWKYLGVTPINKRSLPQGFSKVKVEKEGFKPVEEFVYRYRKDLDLKLHSSTEAPANMVFIGGKRTTVTLVGYDHLEPKAVGDFWMDKYEVSNKEYKVFINEGGYSNIQYWKHPIISNGKQLTWEEAMALFIDKTGEPGPADWEAGTYLNGMEDFPVGGISWYEAAAYAEFIGKELPSLYHWNLAGFTYMSGVIVPKSNLKNDEPWKVGQSNAMSKGGALDMAGNVREWVYNLESKTGDRFILGGGWDDQPYSFTDAYSLPPIVRAKTNGLRCILPIHNEGLDSLKMSLVNPQRYFSEEVPIDNDMLNVLLRQYDYDKTELAPEIEFTDSSNEHYIKQKVWINAAYGNERLPIYIYLPRNVEPPYQTVLMFPGDGGFHTSSSENLYLPEFMLKSGRAVISPIYKGIYERQAELRSSLPNESNQYREFVIMWSKDLMRTVDYLETQKQFDINKLAYLGASWGGRIAPIMLVNENRIKVAILFVAGLRSQLSLPEVDPFNFLPRVKVPLLMLNGEYDFYFPVESSQRPMFEQIGTAPEHKRWKIYPGSHNVPRTELVKESLGWLNKYFGSTRTSKK